MLQFDTRTADLLENAYQGAEFTRRRQASFDALRPGPGERILDIGSGPGLLTAELARAVGPTGQVCGVDPSSAMLASATARCEGFKNVRLAGGTAHALPVPDGWADKAVAVQVFEYIEDLEEAAREALRTLRPGGTLVISDVHFDSVAWFSDNRERMQRMMAAWDAHCAHREVVAQLLPILRGAGHSIEDVRPVTLCDHHLKPDGVAISMMHLMRGFAKSNDLMPAAEADAWFAEQEALARAGRFFFSLTQFVLIARKAGPAHDRLPLR